MPANASFLSPTSLIALHSLHPRQLTDSILPAWLNRSTNTVLILFAWPCILLGTVYLLLFFILNSSWAPKILHGQLGSFLRGDYHAETMATDALLQTLTMTNVRLTEAGKEENIVFAPLVEAKIPIAELVDLVTSNTLRIGRIKAYNADVVLDFTKGELNILKVVLPYPSKPDPPDPEPGTFSVFLADLNVEKTAVHLIFDGFRIDLYDVDVDHYGIRTGAVLEMTSPLAKDNDGKEAIRVSYGMLDFNPGLFSFSLSAVGDADQGLVMSGGPGSAGKIGDAHQMMARHLERMLRQDPQYAEKLGVGPDMRGHFLIPLKKTLVDGFDWHTNTFKIPGMTTEIGNGGWLVMRDGMMNVGPTKEDLEEHAKHYKHKPSGLLPEESILWGASIDMDLKVSDPILSYFFGPILIGDEKFKLQASMAGDLARVSGDIALDMPAFNTFNVDVTRATLRAQMDGQHLSIHRFEADTKLGSVLLGGYYEIMDGDFDLDLWAGKSPAVTEQPTIDEAFRARLDEGLTPLAIMPEGAIQRFSGLLSTHLKATSQDGVITVSLPDPIAYHFDTTLARVDNVRIRSMSSQNNRILTYHNSTITSPGGLDIDLGTDFVRITPGMRLNLNDLTDLNVGIRLHAERPAAYAEFFGFSGLQAGPLDLQFNYNKCGAETCGGLNLKTGALSYMGIDVPNVDIDLDLENSKLTTTAFKIDTAFARIKANLQAQVTAQTIADPMEMPFNAEIQITDVDLDSIALDALAGLGLQGTGEGTLVVKGPIKDISGNLIYTMNNIEVMDVPASRLTLRASYANNKLNIPALNLWFKPSELSTETPQTGTSFAQADTGIAQTEILGTTRAQTSRIHTSATPNMMQMSGTEWLGNETATLTPSHQRRAMRNNDAIVRRRTPDLSLGAFTYDLKHQTLIFNVNLQPISPNEFQIFRELDLPVEGELSLDLSANIDLKLLTKPKRRIEDASKGTWIEGEINLNNAKFGDINLGNTQILMSRSAQYALIKGNIIDIFELSGFVRTAPHFSVSVSLNFPDLNVLETLKQLNIDVSSLVQSFRIHDAGLSGSIGFCMKSLDDMQVSVMLDDIHASVLGHTLELTQPAFIRGDIDEQSVNLSQLELKYRDSVLKLSGQGNMKGDISFDLNGEIDAALAHSFVDSVRNASGLFGINLTARGNIFHEGALSFKNIEMAGYLGVRDPIQVLTDLSQSPIELKQGFILIDRESSRCKSNELCLYTPEDLPFMLGINDHWLNLSLLTTSSGYVDIDLGGTINAALAQLFVKDISAARGAVDLQVNVHGALVDKTRTIDFDLNKLNYDVLLAVSDPISVELNSLNEPITLDDGTFKITEGKDCSNQGQCIVIPKDQGFRGSLMGGNFLIFGEILREGFTPKSGDLSITANNISFRMRDELALTLSPDIQIHAKDLADFNTVKVSGDIDVAEAKYKKNFDDGSSNFIRDQIMSIFVDSRKRVDTYSPSFLRKNPELGKINLDVGVSAENSINVDVKIATANVALELGSQLRIGGTVRDFAPTGIFSISQGVFSLQGNDFEFQNGAQIAFNGSLDGKIDITATTEINTSSDAFSSVTGNSDLDRRKRVSTSSANTSSDLYAITLTVGGTVFRPVWSFESSPYLTDTNVYALILTGKTIDDFSGNDIAMKSLLSPIFSSQLDTFINADEFKFVFSEGAAQFVFIKQMNKGLRIAAAVSIRGSEGNEQALSGEYYFNDNWFVDLTGQNTSDEEGKAPTFKLGARLHWHLPIE